MATSIPLPTPHWLLPYTDPLIDAIVADLGGEWRPLYVRCLADEVRANPLGGILLAWRALDAAEQAMQRRTRGWPGS